jgi:uncharacterized protein YdhG (YjbR/CyaY superfamily)
MRSPDADRQHQHRIGGSNMATRYLDVDDYIASLAPGARDAMTAARAAVHAAVPGVGETISYQMPTFTLDGAAFVYVAGWKHHLGIYPVPVFDADLEAAVAPHRAKTDTVQFPYRSGVPFELLGRIVAAMAARRPAAG